MDKQKVLEILNANNLHADRNFGQNFLCNDEIIERIVKTSDIRDDSNILEIGPGIGSLTEYVIRYLNGNLQYTVVEIDKRLSEYLTDHELFKDYANVINEDFLKLKREDYLPYKGFDFVLSNIPYNITTPLIKKLLVDCNSAERMTFMVETDAIDRICAAPKSKQYGPLAVLCSVYGMINKEFNVSPENFYPMPHTMSSVITLTKKLDLNNSGFVITDGFVEFVEACFSQRRKTLFNSLKSYFDTHSTGLPLQKALFMLRINPNTRAEVLTPEQFVDIYSKINLMA